MRVLNKSESWLSATSRSWLSSSYGKVATRIAEYCLFFNSPWTIVDPNNSPFSISSNMQRHPSARNGVLMICLNSIPLPLLFSSVNTSTVTFASSINLQQWSWSLMFIGFLSMSLARWAPFQPSSFKRFLRFTKRSYSESGWYAPQIRTDSPSLLSSLINSASWKILRKSRSIIPPICLYWIFYIISSVQGILT